MLLLRSDRQWRALTFTGAMLSAHAAWWKTHSFNTGGRLQRHTPSCQFEETGFEGLLTAVLYKDDSVWLSSA